MVAADPPTIATLHHRDDSTTPTCLLICTFLSPVGLTSPTRLTKVRPELQAHSTTHVQAS